VGKVFCKTSPSSDIAAEHSAGVSNVPDVSLPDENTGVMDALGETELVHTSLKATFQEVFDLQGEHVIELHAGFVEDTDTDETANEGIAFEEALGVFLVEGEQLTIVMSAM
jgi:hypothetical protein